MNCGFLLYPQKFRPHPSEDRVFEAEITGQQDPKLLLSNQYRQHPWRRDPSRRQPSECGPEIPSSGPLLLPPTRKTHGSIGSLGKASRHYTGNMAARDCRDQADPRVRAGLAARHFPRRCQVSRAWLMWPRPDRRVRSFSSNRQSVSRHKQISFPKSRRALQQEARPHGRTGAGKPRDPQVTVRLIRPLRPRCANLRRQRGSSGGQIGIANFPALKYLRQSSWPVPQHARRRPKGEFVQEVRKMI